MSDGLDGAGGAVHRLSAGRVLAILVLIGVVVSLILIAITPQLVSRSFAAFVSVSVFIVPGEVWLIFRAPPPRKQLTTRTLIEVLVAFGANGAFWTVAGVWLFFSHDLS